MAPEVIEKTGYNFSADIWSVGILMYEMRFGMTPFQHQNRMFMQNMIINEPVHWPAQSRQARSQQFDEVVAMLLNKDKNERPQSIDEVMEHDWFPKGDELQAIIDQREDIQTVLSEETWGKLPPFIPTPINENDESTWEHFEIKKGRNVMKETIITKAQRDKINQHQNLFIQFETTR